MDHDGILPTVAENLNDKCVLTVHLRVGLTNCRTHILDGRIIPAKIQRRKCPTEMIILVPVEPTADTLHKAMVILRNPHNHPAHPTTKPSVQDQVKLTAAVNAAGLTGLTVQKLLNGKFHSAVPPSTSIVYGGARVSETSPAFTASRKVRDFISKKKKEEHPCGMGWEVLVTFRRVEGKMNEWGVAGFLDRFKHCLTFGSLYCDGQDTLAFEQLFTELFDTIKLVTGNPLKVAPFYPDAKCHAIIMDGEVPQALGLGQKTAIESTAVAATATGGSPIGQSVITRLKSILGLSTQAEIDEWHVFCADQTHPAIHNWYAHKLANPWVLPTVNKFLSNMAPDDWDITPIHSNLTETAHAGRNAETSTNVGLLTAILEAHERDNIKAKELAQIELHGVMRNRWNGSAEREKLSAQRQVSKIRSAAHRHDQLTSYETLKTERDIGTNENKESLQHEKVLEAQVKSLQEQMKIDKHRSDLKEQVNDLRKDIEGEKGLRRDWRLRCQTIDAEIAQLKSGPLAGVRLKGRRPARPSGEKDSIETPGECITSTDSRPPSPSTL
ncbi:hypothetical protein DFH07DRAFT_750775 [Mycena maculata]|uniref:Uncharacterized protein n=1 Tax=Mycena maculata TaxID=230809 RepID=A0AAD7N1M1_9AGAR|nr:hypothetical protein DFH07DRAFT_750775 [Mycena maculata]